MSSPSPSVNRHFPNGMSSFPVGTISPKADVDIHPITAQRFNSAKCIMDTSYYTAISDKRAYLWHGMVPIEAKLEDVQKEYKALYKLHEELHAKHQALQAATSLLIADVEKESILNDAKVALFLSIVNAKSLTDLPIYRQPATPEPATHTPERCRTSTSCPTTPRASSKSGVKLDKVEKSENATNQPLDGSEEAKCQEGPIAVARRVSFGPAVVDLANTFSASIHLQDRV